MSLLSQLGRGVAPVTLALAVALATSVPAARPHAAARAEAAPAAPLSGGLLAAFAASSGRAGALPLAYASAFAAQRALPMHVAEAAVPALRDARTPSGALEQLALQAGFGSIGQSPDPVTLAQTRIASMLGAISPLVTGIPTSQASGAGNLAYTLGLVDPHSGALHLSYQDLSIPARGYPLEIRRTYAPQLGATSALGDGWTFSYGVRLSFDTQSGLPQVEEDDGTTTHFAPWTAPATYLATDAPVRELLVLHPDRSATRQLPGGAYQDFDSQGRLVRLVDGAGQGLTVRYAGSALAEVDDGAGRSLRFGYDAAGLIDSIADPLGTTVRYLHDADRHLTAVTDALGRTTRFTYASGLLARITEPRGATISFAYDPSSRVASVIGPGPLATAIEYVPDATPGTMHTYFSAGDGARTEIDTAVTPPTELQCGTSNGASSGSGLIGVICLGVDPAGRTYSERTSVAGGGATSAINMPGALIFHDAAGRVTTIARDAAGRPLSMQSPEHGLTRFTYDQATSAPTSITDSAGHATMLSYDNAGHVRAIRDASGAVTRIEEPAPNVFRLIGPQGTANELAFDDAGNVVRAIDALGRQTRLTWDRDGRLTVLDDPDQGRLTYRYDAAGEITRRTDATGASTSYAYDADGNLASVTDALGHTWRFSYDDRDLPIQLTDAMGGTTRLTYDAAGRLIAIADPLGHVTRLGYDADGHVTAITDPLGGVMRYRYDAGGDLVAATTPRGETTTMGYDAAGREAAVTDPAGATTTWRYDAMGRPIATQRPDGVTITTTYDALGRVVRRAAPDGSGMAVIYDAAGNPSRVAGATQATATSGIRFTRDAAGAVTSVVDAAGRVVRYTYDASGRRASMTDPTGATTRYTYDAAGRITAISDPLGTFRFSYDPLGRRSAASLPGGVTARYSYDALSRLTGIAYRRGTRIVARFAYTYDADGNVRGEESGTGRRTYSYDALNRLVAVSGPGATAARYTYDADGDLLSSPAGGEWRYDADGRLIAAAGVRFSYDGAGRLTHSSDGTTYTWDQSGRLLTVDGPHGHVGYSYDPLGRPISRTGNGRTVSYVYDGATAIASLDAATGQDARTLYGPWLDEALASMQGGATAIYLHDRLGSVRQVLDASGKTLAVRDYSAFGEQIDGHGTLGAVPGFTGRPTDPATGLIDLRSRVYDPRYARFLAPDPVDTAGPARYAYAGDNPITFYDPLGLDFSVPFDWGAIDDEWTRIADIFDQFGGDDVATGFFIETGETEATIAAEETAAEIAAAEAEGGLFGIMGEVRHLAHEGGFPLDAAMVGLAIYNYYNHPTLGNLLKLDAEWALLGIGLANPLLGLGLGLVWKLAEPYIFGPEAPGEGGAEQAGKNALDNLDPTLIELSEPQIAGSGSIAGRAMLTLARGRGPADVALLYPVPAAGNATTIIFDAHGRRVRVLDRARPVDAPAAGTTWDGRDTAGHLVPDGRYYALTDVADATNPMSDTVAMQTVAVTSAPAPSATPPAQHPTPGLTAHIVLPPDGAIVRGEVPITGSAAGPDFSHYVLDYGAGDVPGAWTTLTQGTQAVNLRGRLTLPGEYTLYGNLATLDTGISNYRYDYRHVVQGEGLNGRYTIRLRVYGRHGAVIETRTHILVGRAAPYITDSLVDSADGRALLTVPALAIHDAVQLFAVERVDQAPPIPAELRDITPVYAVHPAGYTFGTPAALRIDAPAAPGAALYGWDQRVRQWQPLPTSRSADGRGFTTAVSSVADAPALYTVLQGQAPPPAPFLFDLLGGRTQAGAVMLAGLARPGETVWALDDGQPAGERVTAGADGLFTMAAVPVHAGGNRLQAVAQDMSGQRSALSAPLTVTVQSTRVTLATLRLRTADFAGPAPAPLGPGDLIGIEAQLAPGAAAVDGLTVHLSSAADRAGLDVLLRPVAGGARYRAVFAVGPSAAPDVPAIAALGAGDVIRAAASGRTTSITYHDEQGPEPPRIDSSTHPAAIAGAFARANSARPADPAPLGATIERIPGAAPGHQAALPISAGPAGEITARVPIAPYDLAAHPAIDFAYDVPATVRVDLAVRANGTWWVFGLSDLPPYALDSGRALFMPLYDTNRLQRDGHWHQLHIDAYQWLRTVIPTGPIMVDRIAFGDWERGGWMAVRPSHANAPGASFLLADVAIPAVSRQPVVQVSWSDQDPSGISAYSFVLDGRPDTVPPVRSMGLVTHATFGPLRGGAYWLHVRARDGAGNWGPAADYPVVIDTSPPLAGTPDPVPGGTGEAVASVRLRDSGGSGIDPASLRFSAFGHVYGPESGAISYDLETGIASFNMGYLQPPPAGLYPGHAVPVALVAAADAAGNRLAHPLAWTYTLDIPNGLPGGPQLLTVHGGDAPAISPDSTRVAFISSRRAGAHLWVMDAGDLAERGQTARQIVSGPGAEADPAWSPDGAQIAFASTRDGGQHLWLVAPDGSHLRALTSGPGADAHPTWSPDGKQIAFVRNGDLWIVNRDGGAPHPLLADGDHAVREPAWSPDGRLIAFRHSLYVDQIWTVRPDGTHAGALTQLATGEAQSAPAWLADGRVAYVSRRGAVSAIYTVNPDGTDQSLFKNVRKTSCSHLLVAQIRGNAAK